MSKASGLVLARMALPAFTKAGFHTRTLIWRAAPAFGGPPFATFPIEGTEAHDLAVIPKLA